MKITVEQEFFAVSPAGAMRNVDDLIICTSRDIATKVVEEEQDLTGNQLIIVPVKVFIPMTMVGGSLTIEQEAVR